MSFRMRILLSRISLTNANLNSFTFSVNVNENIFLC